ncbi:type II toxin-antitoxin system RelE/ParE family toxin [Fibrobacter sp. UWH4]|uniref:type II toxin-antitoxin system RelE/ParE family toxin n=1 Tax=Fibrobacter sp. UWH4 TaxID=1896210 RepID=UPI000912A38D|nr:type II toxin-antitoxin system RelE/ParE family toxin [Fibrobacter sp. UWH4]SHK28347.1 addiction module toxin, RelE/StbE family [Fibrobacter sp. UWH4]
MPSKKFQVVWSESAALDLKSIVLFIAQNSMQNAHEAFAKIKKECLLLEKFPDLGKIPIELEDLQIGGYRELTINPWRVFYRKQAEQIVVLAVVDSRRDLEDALWNRLMR